MTLPFRIDPEVFEVPRRPRLHSPEPENAIRWLIDGHPATVRVWTAEEWASSTDRPKDAQPCSNGTWCSLTID